MPRKQKPPFEEAVTASPLFKLALEIRIMIYELLLIQEGGMFIPSDIFTRRDYGRTGSTPYQCEFCGLVFLSHPSCTQHLKKHHGRCPRLLYLHPLETLLPVVSVSLLQTCRLIRVEASPILYSKNAFHFSDPTTASNFRWGTDTAQARATQEIAIKMGSNYHAPWATYLTKQTLSLGQDFPHLKRMTINLDAWVGLEEATLLRSMSEGLRKRSRGLEWVCVLTLNDEKVLDCFEPLVEKEDESKNGEEKVQKHVWAQGTSKLWKNALLWWGLPGEAVPQKYRSVGDQPQLQVPSA